MKVVPALALVLAAIPGIRALAFLDQDRPRPKAEQDEEGEEQGEEAEGQEGREGAERSFTDVFFEDERELASSGANPYFVLEPGYALVLESERNGRKVSITITVLDATKVIAGVETRAVEDKEVVDGVVKEVTRDYYAISKRTNNVYYFGEDVDVYKDGQLAGHKGSWLAGEKGARYGLAMPGAPLLGARYQQEVAPGEAMDRGEVVSLSETFQCPAGTFENVLRIEETNPLEEGDKEYKLYARGVGLLQDESLKLVKYGKAAK